MENREIRNYNNEIRTNEDSRSVEGYALVFNSLSEDLGGFREQISRDAIDIDIIGHSDIRALLNHNDSRGILARSRYGKGSLTLEIDERGLKYRFDAPKTALGDEVLEYLRRGDITSSSFAFTVDSDTWQKMEDGSYLRTINKFDRLFDVSPVFEPAYQETSVSCRSFEEFKQKEAEELEEQRKLEEQRAAEEEAQKQKEQEEALKSYYEKLRSDNADLLNK